MYEKGSLAEDRCMMTVYLAEAHMHPRNERTSVWMSEQASVAARESIAMSQSAGPAIPFFPPWQ